MKFFELLVGGLPVLLVGHGVVIGAVVAVSWIMDQDEVNVAEQEGNSVSIMIITHQLEC